MGVGTQNLITNSFEARTGKLLNSIYGNGQQVSSDYDNLDRVAAKKYNGTSRYTYEYDASGNVGLKKDLVNGVDYRYIFDVANRPVKTTDSKGNSLSSTYDANNNNNKVSDKINGTTYDTSYAFDKDNKPTTTTYTRATANTITQSYDPTIGRLTSKAVNTGLATFNTSFGYLPGTNGATTTKVGSITNNGSPISYTYDANGNIDTITQNSQAIKYYYNELNEVIREDNQVVNKTITNSYDAGGNLTNKTEYPYTTGSLGTATISYPYVYGDTNWKDKLTSYNGNAITYDAIGNPLTYNGNTFTWEEGRQLAALSGNGNTISYKYNDAGIRTSKTVNGVTTNYHLVGDKVTYETNGADSIYYTYDSSGQLASMDLNGVEYYYIKNAQGDVIGLFDKTGTQVVSYTYDTWGKLISTTGSLASTVGVKNPYLYRGYTYDTETGLYYLQSRYYSPDWGRFINGDGYIGTPGELLSSNMFVYCGNNPINRADPSGLFWGELFAGILAVVAIPEEAIVLMIAATVLAVVYLGYQIYDHYSRSSVTYSDSSTPAATGTTGSSQTKVKTTSGSKATSSGKSKVKNKLKPDPNAQGDHSTFKRDPVTGEITSHETWTANPMNPTGFDGDLRLDTTGSPHMNPITGEQLMPHVHDKAAPGGVRAPISWEVPGMP